MGIGRKKLADALSSTLGGKMDVPDMQPALLGAYINGQKTIPVNGQPDYVWCRIGGNTSQQVKAFNQHAGGVAHHWDLPIIITRDQINPDIWKVAGRDVRKYGGWGASGNLPVSSPYIVPHGNDHSFSSQAGMGSDPVWVFKRQLMPLLPHPAPTGTMAIDIGADFYFFDGRFRWFPSTGTASLTSHLPTGAGNGRFVTIYIDGNSGNPAYLDGPEISALTPPADAGQYISIPTPDQGVAVAAVFLLSGSNRIGWGEIFDLRWPHSPVPGSGTAPAIYDDGALVAQTFHLNATRGINAASSGSFVEMTLDQGFSPTWTAQHTFQALTLFGGLVGMGNDLHVTGTVYSGAGSFVSEQGYFRGQYMDFHVQGSPPSAPPAGQGRFYSYDNRPYFRSAAGTSYDLSLVSAGVMNWDDGVPLATGTFIDWGDNLDVTISGSVVRVNAQAGGGGGGSGLGVMNWDDGAPLGTGTIFDWGRGLDASISGTVVSASSAAWNVPSLLNSTKSSADTPDDDFDGTSLDVKWTAVDGGAGTVSLLAGAGAGIYQVGGRNGWIQFLVGTSSGDGVTLRQDYTLPDGACIVAPLAFSIDWAAQPANNEVWLGIGVNDNDGGITAGAAGQTALVFFDTDANGWRTLAYDGSAVIGVDRTTRTAIAPMAYFRISRSGLNYDIFASSHGYSWTYLGRKTMSSAANNVWLFAECRATMANRVVCGCPWFRQGTALTPDPWSLL